MCYVIAKDRYGHGCIAFETVHGKHLADLKWSLDEALGNTGVEIMTISHPEAYGEYAPYHFVQTEEELLFACGILSGYYELVSAAVSNYQTDLRRNG